MNIQIVDVSKNIIEQVTCFVKKGIKTVIRYYSYYIDDAKVITKEEAQAILNAGLQLGIVYEARNGNQLEAFTSETGHNDAAAAFTYASETIKQPFESAIYFAVDLDITDTQMKDNVIPYFKAIQSFFEKNKGYKIGVYGCGTVVNTLKNLGLCEYRWLSESTSFSGTQKALENHEYELAQQYHKDITICNISSLDKDVLREGLTLNDIGTFSSLGV